MKLSQKSQILLERYLLAVERRLPWQGRKDITSEIRANLMDTLEDHYPPEAIVDETMLEEELRKLGSPGSVASGYRGTDALIAPQHNAIFRLIVTRLTPIVVAVVFFAGLLSFVLSGGKNPFWSIWEMLGTAWQVAVGIIGTSAIVFMILTRYFPKVNEGIFTEILEEEGKTWKVGDLPELVAKEEKVELWELVLGVTFGTLGLVILLFLFDQVVGFWWLSDDKWRMVPVFTDAFKAYIPWIAVNMGLSLGLTILLFQTHRKTILTRVFDIGIKVSELTLTAALLGAGTLLTFDTGLALQQGFPSEAITGIQTLFQYDFVRWFLIFLVVVLSIDLIKKVVDLARSVARQTR
jgi:hypothetical protein